ncbi:MAG: methyltransferase domain-containing protein [Candidatus Aminicenantes bacterium]|nr:methyltransferase domain-containing protein [Candidatus Aminicenantes bacterium]NIM83565.1 methyltransferase domain-containing protein [Candidatus Aminicenantes bacterium]NIN22965.1 methyltransferase domain-containing protein [Candidatus Aminicenantes bacterium]NIN46702.1 methyltransferase domain-containing protein [Candidatus Aminicenantes bacterium]NIN89608.1 methyltransferase domain-containing protein [Candidatus Aminicenantes bacterium]
MTDITNKQLTNSQFKELQDFIYQKSGMFFPFSRKHYIEQKVMKRIAALRYNSFSNYLNILKHERIRSEIINLFNEVTVNETFFFRDLPQLEVLEKHIFPEAQTRGKKHLNILSAGCSSGEEPYTIAIIMREKFPQLSYNIVGIDISDLVVAKAIRGEYTQYAVRFVPKDYLEKYFSLTKQGNYKFHDHYKTNIKFHTLNLMELDTAPVNVSSFDVIFCRYVLIYFDRESKQEVINRFHDKIADNGYLILGNSESLFSVANNFRMLHFPSAIIYNRN